VKRVILIGGLLAGIIVLAQQQASAQAAPLGRIRTFNVTCTTSATPIKPPDGLTSISAWSVWQNSATPVYIGGSDVTNGTTKGWPICTDTAVCPASTISFDANAVGFCRAGSSQTVVVVSGNK